MTAPSTLVVSETDVLTAVQHIDSIYCSRGVDVNPFGLLTRLGLVLTGNKQEGDHGGQEEHREEHHEQGYGFLVFHRGKNTQKSPKEKILRAVITRGFWSMTTWQAVRPWP